jgi:NADPH:quinone reductase-like Zn-dependent oxidoreductase
MKAIKCTKYGPPHVLQIVNTSKPIPKENEVLIRVVATTVTIADCRVRGFAVPASFWLPAKLALGFTKPRQPILGGELAGIIEQVGKKVTKWKEGDRVFAFTGHKLGAYVGYKCLAQDDCIASKPDGLSFSESAALSFGGITALYFLRKGNIKAGEKVFIYGASGSVGTYAVQLAKYFGATVTAVCSTQNMELVKSLGADRVLDYTQPDFENIQETCKETFDLVFDAVGKGNISKLIGCIQPNGRYLHALSTPFTEMKIRLLLLKKKIKFFGGTFTANTEQINHIQQLADEGHIKPMIDKEYDFGDIVTAHEYVDKGHKRGNVTINMMGTE